jgi:hypothetical protein
MKMNKGVGRGVSQGKAKTQTAGHHTIANVQIVLPLMQDGNKTENGQRAGGIIIEKTVSFHYIKKDYYSQTLEKRSSDPPPNPPAGLVELLLVVVAGVMGEALVQPPKSSSAATAGAGLGGGAPQPLPMSLAVSVSGTFIMEAPDEAAGAGAGAEAGSGLLQALPPQGSIIPAAAAGTAGFWAC